MKTHEEEKDESAGSGGDWGDFDKYEDPNDVQFPTQFSATPTLESLPSVDTQPEN